MGLKDRLAILPHANKGPDCSVGVMYEAMGTDDAEAFKAALLNPAWIATELENAMGDEGYVISDSTIRRHRKMRCKCKENRPSIFEAS